MAGKPNVVIPAVDGVWRETAFGECLFDSLGLSGHKAQAVYSYSAATAKLHLSSLVPGLPFGHAQTCPAHEAKERQCTVLAPANKNGIAPCVAVLVTDGRGSVFLTRRPTWMKSFPCMWVPAGGHVEPDETLEQAACREVWEETGLVLPPTSLQPLAIWESLYPTRLQSGPLRNHQLVVYFQAKTDSPLSSFRLQQEEVDRAAWFSREAIEDIISANRHSTLSYTAISLEKADGIISQGHQGSQPLATATFSVSTVTSANRGEASKEGISVGTLFALEQLLVANEPKALDGTGNMAQTST